MSLEQSNDTRPVTSMLKDLSNRGIKEMIWLCMKLLRCSSATLNTTSKRPGIVAIIQQVKDTYLFCCFTGLAFIDVKSLGYSDIETREGTLWIKKKRQKTKNWCHIPLLPPAVLLMKKYKSHPYCLKNGCVLPVLSNQKMNKIIH